MPQAAWKCIEYYFFLSSFSPEWSSHIGVSLCLVLPVAPISGPPKPPRPSDAHSSSQPLFSKMDALKVPRQVWRLCVFFPPLVWSSQVGRGSIGWDRRCVFTWCEPRGVRIDSTNCRSLRSVTLCSHKHRPGGELRPWNTHITHDIFYA